MTLSVVPIPDCAFGFDCFEPLTAQSLDAILFAGWNGHEFEFVVQYLENLTQDRARMILSRRTKVTNRPLGLWTVSIARNDSMRDPCSEFGERDGTTAMAYLTKLGLPPGHSHGIDVEGTTKATRQGVAGYVNAYDRTIRGHVKAAMYDGWGEPLDASQLYTDLTVRSYWAASPYTAAPIIRGFGMVQERENVKVGGVPIDIDRAHTDGLGDSFMMVIDGDA